MDIWALHDVQNVLAQGVNGVALFGRDIFLLMLACVQRQHWDPQVRGSDGVWALVCFGAWRLAMHGKFVKMLYHQS